MRILPQIARRALMSCATLALIATAPAAWPQGSKFPDRPVKLIVTYPPGGSSDLMARVLGQKLSDLWGQPVIVENKAGAAGSIGMDYAAHQPNDGYAFVIGNLGPAGVNPLLQKLPYSMEKDFMPIAKVAEIHYVISASAKLPVKSLTELIDLARAQPERVKFSSAQLKARCR